MKSKINPLLKLVDSTLIYEPDTGLLRIKKTNRPLYADYTGMVSVHIVATQTILKMKLDKLCYFMHHRRLPTRSERLLHRNLDKEDNSLKNLVVVPRDKYLELQEAILNLNSLLKITPHKYDQYMFTVQYRKANKQERINCNDIISAQEQERKLRLMFIKLVTKYCNTNTAV